MKPLHRGIALGVLQCLLVLSVAGKYAWDRERLPRVWVKTAPVDPYLPIRGRYVSLRLEVAVPEGQTAQWTPVSLTVENGALTARPAAARTGIMVTGGKPWALAEPVAYFIPEHAADPTRLHPGEELWVEVSVPPAGPPRPLRLGVRRAGVLTPIEIR